LKPCSFARRQKPRTDTLTDNLNNNLLRRPPCRSPQAPGNSIESDLKALHTMAGPTIAKSNNPVTKRYSVLQLALIGRRHETK